MENYWAVVYHNAFAPNDISIVTYRSKSEAVKDIKKWSPDVSHAELYLNGKKIAYKEESNGTVRPFKEND